MSGWGRAALDSLNVPQSIFKRRMRGGGENEDNADEPFPIDPPEKNNECIYYNFNMVNNNGTSVQATTQENLNGPIISNAKDYFLSCIRFVMDGSSIPIFNFKTGAYKVSLTTIGQLTNLLAIGQATVLYSGQDAEFGLQSVYSYTDFLQMINDAYARAMIALGVALTANGDLPAQRPTTVAPYMVFVPQSGTCPIFIPTPYIGNADPRVNIKVFMNIELYEFFDNFYIHKFGESLPSGLDVQILAVDLQGTNLNTQTPFVPPLFFMMQQEYNSLFKWVQYTGITFESNSLGVRPEYIPTQNVSLNSLTAQGNAGTGPPSTNLLTDFQPYLAPGDSAGIRGYLYYTPSSQYRLINMLKDTISTLDLTVNLRDKIGNTVPYYIPPFQSLQVKIIFAHKSLFQGNTGH
jgi:hypothetical protein